MWFSCTGLENSCWLFAVGHALFAAGFEFLATSNSFSLVRFLTSEFWTMWRRHDCRRDAGARFALRGVRNALCAALLLQIDSD
jgi:ABC-type uncharacterized transport system YnjBCD permease subunit